MPIDVRETDPDGIDYGWIMQVTFVITIVVGAPTVAILSLFASVPTWSDRVAFAIRVGAAIWLVTLLGTFTYARQYRDDDDDETDAQTDADS